MNAGRIQGWPALRARSLALAACLLSAMVAAPAAQQKKPLTNQDIVTMVKGGLEESIILLAIDASATEFDTSPEALIALKKQAVRETIIRAMLVAQAKKSGRVISPSPVLEQPPSREQPQVTPPASAASQALSPAEEQQVRTLAEQVLSQSRRLLAQPMAQNLHELLDQGLSGEDLPTPFKAIFVDLFAPHRQALHQFLDQVARLRQLLNKPSGRRSDVHSPSPFVRPVLWVSPNEAGPPPMVGSQWRSASRPYRDSPLWLINSQAGVQVSDTSGPGSESHTYSGQDLGKGVTETIKFDDWVDTPDSIGEGMNTEGNTTIEANTPEHGTVSLNTSYKINDGARVDRCPTADGKVAGKSEFEWGGTSEVTGTGVSAGGREVRRFDATAEGRVGDDARLREVVVQVDFNYEKRVGPELTILRWRGTATFDPHGSEKWLPVQLTGCSGNQGAIPVAGCRAEFPVDRLRDAYLRAENKWNFTEPGPGETEEVGSKCVIVKFTPLTKTVAGHPRQTVKVKAELLAVKGNQPTWGTFDELKPILEQEIQENRTRTSPGAPGELTYTAPSKPWRCNDPPGFGVYGARSRAGALKAGGYRADEAGVTYDEYAWFLAPCLRLSIHERDEAHVMIASSLSEVTFPMDLMVNEQGQLTGEARVQREAWTQVSLVGCAAVEHWTEQWHASGTLNEKTKTLTLKLWFEAGQRQGTETCKVGPSVGSDEGRVGPRGGPVKAPYTTPAFRSDAFPSPLDQFTLPDKAGATQHFQSPCSVWSVTSMLCFTGPVGITKAISG